MRIATGSKTLAARRSQTDRSEDTQQKLVKATISLLKRKGYAGFRTAAAADEAGVSRGGMMHHFASKDSLVLAAVEDILVRARKRALRNIRAARDSDDPIAAIAADAKEFFFHEDFAVVLDVTLLGGKNPAFKTHIQHYAEENRAPLEQAWVALLIHRGLRCRRCRRRASPDSGDRPRIVCPGPEGGRSRLFRSPAATLGKYHPGPSRRPDLIPREFLSPVWYACISFTPDLEHGNES